MGGKQSGILEDWLKNIFSLIFLQSFHAVFLAFIIEIIGQMQCYSTDANGKALLDSLGAEDAKVALICMISMLALLKMEKMIKDIFGIKDSKFSKGLQESFTGGVAKVASAVDMAKRTGKAIEGKQEASKKLRTAKKDVIDATTKHSEKTAEYERLKSSNAAAEGLTKKEYNEKLKSAQKEAKEAKDNLDSKKAAQTKAEADYNMAKRQAVTAVATDTASMAFSLGNPALANLVDRGLDSVGNRINKNSVYGSAASNINEQIEQKTMSAARERVRKNHPGLSETDPRFERELDHVLNDAKFKSEMQKKLKAEVEAKFQLEMEIPESKLKGLGNAIKQSWAEGVRDVTGDNAGRAYSRRVRKEGIHYKGESVDDI